MLANQATAAATAAKASFEKSCAVCTKTYYSENAYNNHLNSQKHRSNVAKAGRGQVDDAASVSGSVMSSAFSLGESMPESDATGIDREADKEFSQVVDAIKNTKLDAEEPVSRRPTRPHHSQPELKPEHPLSPIDTNSSTQGDDKDSVASSKAPTDPLLDCLFCNYRSPNFSLNINHMGRFHGMFVPEKEFLVEPEKLIKYLHRKIQKRHQCLRCQKIVHSASGIQPHMRDRGHCMIAFESDAELVEIGQFYDFRSSYLMLMTLTRWSKRRRTSPTTPRLQQMEESSWVHPARLSPLLMMTRPCLTKKRTTAGKQIAPSRAFPPTRLPLCLSIALTDTNCSASLVTTHTTIHARTVTLTVSTHMRMLSQWLCITTIMSSTYLRDVLPVTVR